jgi:hypothetical protein
MSSVALLGGCGPGMPGPYRRTFTFTEEGAFA